MSAMNPDSLRIAAYDAAMAAAHASPALREPSVALAQLERAQVLGQRDFGRHWRVHVTMLRAAWALADARELSGQLLRLSLVPLGRRLCERLKVPAHCREIAEIVAREHGHVHASLTLAAAAQLRLLQRCDALRRPARFADILLAC
jgi:hypothetical protein